MTTGRPRSSADELSALLATDPPVLHERSPDDEMFAGDQEGYLETGRSALRCLRLALAGAGRPAPRRILDLPCGHGRVLRWLRAAWPEAELVACDLSRSGVAWCAETFGATGVVSREDPSELELPGAFDLVWCGSLLTHLDAPAWDAFLGLFERVLAPGGLLVVTLHGRLSVQWLRDGRSYGLDTAGVRHVLEGVERSGFGYADYPGQRRYGISVSTPDWVARELVRRGTLRLAGYAETAWHEHQDVVVCQRLDGVAPAPSSGV